MYLLEKYQELSQVDPEHSLKEEVKSILRDYRNFWDVYAELLQNSVDAINRRFRLINDTTYYLYNEFREKNPLYLENNFRGKIEIRVNTKTNTITVLDNGVGIKKHDMLNCLLPKFSGKKIKQDYGFKGYGLTYVAFVSRYYSMKSRYFTSRDTYGYEVSGIFDWVVNDSLPIPEFPEVPVQIQDDELEEYNTKISVRLEDDYQVKFDAVAALDICKELITSSDDIDRFEYILRTKTAIGNTCKLFSQPPVVPIDIELQVILPDESIVRKKIPYEYYHPIEHAEINVHCYEFAEYVSSTMTASFTRGFRGLHHTKINHRIGSRTPIDCNIMIAAVSSTRLGNIERDLRLDTLDSSSKISCGIYLSIDGMPTGIRLDSWDRRGGALKRYYVIVDCKLDISNTLDSGRKGITSHYAGLIDKAVVDLINNSRVSPDTDTFASYASRDLDIGRGNPPGGNSFQVPDFKSDIETSITRNKEGEQSDPEVVEKIKKYSPLLSIPKSEQEVVVLFYSLLSRGLLKGYDVVYQAGPEKVYDAGFEYLLELADENTVPRDPLGIGRLVVDQLKQENRTVYDHSMYYVGKTTFPQLCVEFKLNVGGLLYELNRATNKEPKFIDLLITWDTDIPSQLHGSYTLAPIIDAHRLYHGTTHRLGILGERNTDIMVISLKDILNLLD